MHTREEQLQAFSRLLDVMDDLRAKCPWDKEQTNESLRHLTIEETYELSEAILEANDTEIRKELGDVLLHIVFYAKIGSEKKAFDIADVCHSLCEKLIARHPHIYGDVQVADSAQVKENWEQLKLKEGNKSVLSGVSKGAPSVVKALRMQEKAAQVGFDWETPEQVWDKVKEELHELETERINPENRSRIESEFGDLFFSLINVARKWNLNPDDALEQTNRKFQQRFMYMEASIRAQSKELKSLTLSEWDEFWNQAKQQAL